MEITVVSVGYGAIEIATTTKQILSYLVDQGHHVNLVIDKTYIKSSYYLDQVYQYQIHRSGNACLDKINILKDRFLSSRRISKSDIVICIEIRALLYLKRNGFDISKVIFFSMESMHNVSDGNREEINSAMDSTMVNVIQSEERMSDLNKALDADHKFMYLPVSYRPKEIQFYNNRENKILYSGYLAEWSGLKEFIVNCKWDDDVRVEIQGHDLKTGYYTNELRRLSEKKNITIDTDYIDDSDYFDFLSQYGWGIATYMNLHDSDNWNNLIFSSGKIAAYLWCGMGLITNINVPPDMDIPVQKIDLSRGTKISAEFDKSIFIKSRNAAYKYYNFDNYFSEIMKLS
ncbi:MAG: hypothetical protein ACQETE_08010 [Bacteroidota bacterium]